MPIEYICKFCGKKFIDSPSAKRNYCSHRCGVLANKPALGHGGGTVENICIVCGKAFSDYASNSRKFCSQKCAKIDLKNKLQRTRKGENNPNWKIKDRICLQCGKTFIAFPSKPTKFCSFRCMGIARLGNDNPQWNGGSYARNSTAYWYKKLRQSAFSRDNYQCQKCGSKERLEIHHIKPWIKYPDLRFDLNNITTLCRDCHNFLKPAH